MTAFRGSISDATPKQHVLASALPGTEKRGRPKLPHSRGQNWLGGVIGGILGLIILSPAIGWAHGELLIRIDEVTQRIVAATNTRNDWPRFTWNAAICIAKMRIGRRRKPISTGRRRWRRIGPLWIFSGENCAPPRTNWRPPGVVRQSIGPRRQ